MPKYISVPEEIQFYNPLDRKPVEGEKLTFKDFIISRLLIHPMWMTSYINMKSAQAIDKAVETSNGVMVLDKADWEKLKQVAESPQYTIPSAMGPQTISGLSGIPPLFASQIIPFLEAIIEAKDEKEATNEQ